MKKIPVAIIAGLFLLTLIMPQLALADGPAIANVVVDPTSITSTSATIFWTTNTSSDSVVRYGTNCTSLGTTVSDSSMVTTHFMGLAGLTPGTTYYFEVQSTDASGTSVDNNSDACYQFTTVAPTTYSITLEPACAVCGELWKPAYCGQVIGVTAVVAMAGTYHVCWDSLTAVVQEPTEGTFTASGAGIYTLEFYMPEAAKGSHTVYLVDSTYAQKASAAFEVLPYTRIDPEEGPVGTNVTLKGNGFGASQQIQVKFKGAVIGSTAASPVGSWTVVCTVPETPGGGYTFDVGPKDPDVVWLSKYFKVTPKIAVTPSSGIVRQTIRVGGSGFAKDESGIKVTFDGEVMKTFPYYPVYADANGSWNTTIAVPATQSGGYIIDASGTWTRARYVPDITFTVIPGILVEPISAYVGDAINITGGGFATEETGVRVYFDGMDVTTATIPVDSYGCWASSFALPVSTYGSHTVSASGATTAAVTTNLTTKAKIESLSPVEGAPGDSVSLTGSGFGGDKKLTVTLGGVAATENLQTQYNGNVVISFRVPKGSTEGQRTLVVTDAGGATASVDFTVTKKTLSIAPLPISPGNGTKLRSGEVTFKWQGVTGSTGYTYTLEIVGVWSKSGITGSSYTLTDTETVTETLPEGTHYWRVKIVDDYGNAGPWSDSIKFTVAPIPTWVWVVVGLVVLIVLMVVAYRETKFKVTE